MDQIHIQSQDERAYVTKNRQLMPESWYPDVFLVAVKDGGYELAFSPRIVDGKIVIDTFLSSVKALREAVWHRKEEARLRKEYLAKVAGIKE